MKILVTGGAGFIASHVVDAYVAEGHEVVILDDLSTGRRENLHDGCSFKQIDIRDKEVIDKLFAEEAFDVVNHHAAQMDVRRSVYEPQFDASVNIVGSINLMEACVANGVKKMIYVSTGGAVYGEPESLPVKENDTIKPECPYGITKHTVEHYLHYYSLVSDLKYTVLRYPNVYGPRQNPEGEAGVVAIFSLAMLNNKKVVLYGFGKPVRDYVFVKDVARANVLALTHAENEIVNLGSEHGESVMRLFEELSKLTEYNQEPELKELRKGEIETIYLTGEKAARVLEWSPQVSLADGLAETVEWIREKE